MNEGDISQGAGAALTVGAATGNPWIVGAAVVWLVGDFIWNYFNSQDDPAPASTTINLPTVDEGSVVPLLYGYVHAEQPLMAWMGAVGSFEQSPGNWSYGFNAVFVPGTSFESTSAHLLDIRFGGVPTNATSGTGAWREWSDAANQRGAGGFETEITYWLNPGHADNDIIDGSVQILNGHPGQVTVVSGIAQNWLGHTLLDAGVSAARVQSYRNYISINIRALPIVWGGATDLPARALWAGNANIPAISFVMNLKPNGGGLITAYDAGELGCNPIDVLYDILTGTFNKMATDPANIATDEFIAAAQVCYDENLLYSRKIQSGTPASSMIAEIMAFVNGILYEDMSDGKYHIKLLRADYSPPSLRTISPSNCVKLDSFQMSTWSEVPNMITVSYTDPSTGSAQSISQSSQATAVGQDGVVNELVLQFPGCVSRDQALYMAARELQIRSRPIMKCRVYTTREFDDLKPGDAVYLSWPKLNISSLVFRVLNLTSGVLKDGRIMVNLVQDVFYVYRRRAPVDIGGIGTVTIGPSA